jgi:Ala-tRNA(Pro) deacylase
MTTDYIPESEVILDEVIIWTTFRDIVAVITSEAELLLFLNKNQLEFQRIEHPPVFTCAEAERLRPSVAAVSTKNLFLCDKKGKKFFLVVTACEKNMDLKRLAVQIGVSKLRFGSEENLGRFLGVGRGAVTVLGLVNDVDQRVDLWIDKEIWGEESFLCHPLVNYATLVLSKSVLERFISITGHQIHLFE